MDQSRRQHTRQAIDLQAHFWFDDDHPPQRCSVVDISAGGARLKVDGQIHKSVISALQIGDLGRLKCSVKWVRNDEIGINFNDDPEFIGQMVIAIGMMA